LGGYLQPAPNAGQLPVIPTRTGQLISTRHWIENFVNVRDEGLGVLAVYVGEQSPSVIITQPGQRLSHVPSAAKGSQDAAQAAADADSGQLGRGAVIYLDIENSAQIEPELLAYATAFFEGLTPRGYRPGLYTPFQMARALANRWPGIAVWVVNGTYSHRRPITGDAEADPHPIDPLQREQARVFIERPQIADARRFSTGTHPDDRPDNRVQFPLLWQYALDRPVTIPVLPLTRAQAGRAPRRPGDTGWDFNTSLVRDPSFPAAEPRLAQVPRRADVLALGSVPPPRDDQGAPTDRPGHGGRGGDLWTNQQAPPTPATIPDDAGAAGQRLHPWARPSVAAPLNNASTIAVLTTDQLPAVIEWDMTRRTRWTGAQPIAANAPPVRPLSSVVLERFGADLLWFGIGRDRPNDGRILSSQHDRQGWTPITAVGDANFRVHPLSTLASGQRGQFLEIVVDVFVLDQNTQLRQLWRRLVDPILPAGNNRVIGGTRVALHPQTGIAVAESQARGPVGLVSTIDLFVIGMDGRVYVTSWSDGQDWTDFTAIGGNAFRPLFPTGITAIARGTPLQSTHVFIVDTSGHLATTWRMAGARWDPVTTSQIGGTTVNPHPVTDIAAVGTADDRILVTVTADNGSVVQTSFGPPRAGAPPVWSDFAPVNLPAFVHPP
jgi:hypothetical protein